MHQLLRPDAASPRPSSMPCQALCTLWLLSKHACAPTLPTRQAEARVAQQRQEILADHRTVRPALLRAGMWRASHVWAALPRPACSDVHCTLRKSIEGLSVSPAGSGHAAGPQAFALSSISAYPIKFEFELSHLLEAGMQQAFRLTHSAADPINPTSSSLTCRELACDRLPVWGRRSPQDCMF